MIAKDTDDRERGDFSVTLRRKAAFVARKIA